MMKRIPKVCPLCGRSGEAESIDGQPNKKARRRKEHGGLCTLDVTILNAPSVSYINRQELAIFLGMKLSDVEALIADGVIPDGKARVFRRQKTWTQQDAAVAKYIVDNADRFEKHKATISQMRAVPPEGEQFGQEVVYFISAGEHIKIGFTARTAESRIASIQTGLPTKATVLGTIPGDRKLEKCLHHKFRHLHSHGEWFRAEQELLDFIAETTQEANQGVEA